MNPIAEICCGSLEDALNAQKSGADRIELNNAMFLFGLTPSQATIELVVNHCSVPIIVMARPRPGGFFYNGHEFNTMLKDVELMLAYNIEGVAFGCLDEFGHINIEQNKAIIDLIHQHKKDAVFHRAFDAVQNPYQVVETLIDLGVKRVLTSGLHQKAENGMDLLTELENKYGDTIEILAGGGVTATNVAKFKDKTGITQYHSSCTLWRKDPTTISNVSFSYAKEPHQEEYNLVDFEKAVQFVNAVHNK